MKNKTILILSDCFVNVISTYLYDDYLDYPEALTNLFIKLQKEKLLEEERLQAISTAMGDGKQANEEYKNSYAGLKQQAETAMA